MRVRTLFASALAVLLMAGCDGLADLDVENQNEPDTRRVLATPGDVVGLIGSSYRTWWLSTHHYVGAGPALSVASDAHSASWGNFAMRDFGSEPRQAIDNNPSYGYSYAVEDPWANSYGALKAVNDGLRTMDGAGGGEAVDLGSDETMARAFAKFIQGLSHAQVGMLYDQGFIYDENVGPDEIEAGLELQPYAAVMEAGINQLMEAIEIAQSGSFNTPETWINGVSLTSAELVRLAHGYIARYMAAVARSPAEAQQVDWSAVIAHAQQGPTEAFGPMGDGFVNWYDGLKSYGGVYPGWGRLDLRFLGMADTGGEYQAWMSLPPADRTAFLITTPDRRVTGDTPDSDGAYVQYFSTIPFRPERGTYFFSNYGDMRWFGDDDCDDDADPCDAAAFMDYANTFTTQMPDITPEEMGLLIAEAHLWMGQDAQAAAAINETRAEWLPPVTEAGVPNSSDCVPHKPSATKTCGDLLTALHWEKWMETWHTGMGVDFTDARRWGFLVPGTPLHLPVPGAELQVLELPIYTFGGGGEGSAP